MPPPRQFRSPPDTRYSLYGRLIRGTLPQGDVKLNSVKIPLCGKGPSSHDNPHVICSDIAHYLTHMDFDPAYPTEYLDYSFYPKGHEITIRKQIPILFSIEDQDVYNWQRPSTHSKHFANGRTPQGQKSLV